MPTQSIQRLLELQTKTLNLETSGQDDAYMKALALMWNAQYSEASDRIAQTIESDPDRSDIARLYRAWIECLAKLEDGESLKALGQHLLDMGLEYPEQKQTYMALRGLIHCELDQASAVSLILRSLGQRPYNAYCMELNEIASRRGLCDVPVAVANTNAAIDDYFVWNTLIQDLTVMNDRPALMETLRFVMKKFPGAPLMDEVQMHIAFDSQEWQAALPHAKKLAQEFSNHHDYLFFAALASAKSGDLVGALSLIESDTKDHKSFDPDFMSLYGELLAEKAKASDDQKVADKARVVLKNAVVLSRRFGASAEQTLFKIRELDAAFGGSFDSEQTTNMFREPHQWLVMLSPRRAEEMVTSQDHKIEKLSRAMGKEAAPGDVVLFVSKAAHTAKKANPVRNEWRLLAMYRVVSKPLWHPTSRWHSLLELIDRPEHPVPVDAHEIKSDLDLRGRKSTLPKGHHARYGVYRLDESAMDIMIAAVKRRSDGIDHEKERRQVSQSKNKSV